MNSSRKVAKKVNIKLRNQTRNIEIEPNHLLVLRLYQSLRGHEKPPRPNTLRSLRKADAVSVRPLGHPPQEKPGAIPGMKNMFFLNMSSRCAERKAKQ